MRQYLLPFLFIFSAQSCISPTSGNSIQIDDLSEYLLIDEKMKPEVQQGFLFNMSTFNCIEPLDTVFSNLPFSDFNDAADSLIRLFNHIDASSKSSNAKQYAKALIVADFVYALSSFMIDTEFEDNDSINSIYVNPTNFREVFELANTNQIPLYCGQRTALFKILIDTLVKLPVKIIGRDSGHVFPLVTIQGLDYIIDPFDPFVVMNSVGEIANYSQLNDSSIQIVHSRLFFGGTKALIGANSIDQLRNNRLFCGLIDYFKRKYMNYSKNDFVVGQNFYAPLLVHPRGLFWFAVPQRGRPEKHFILNKSNLRFTYCSYCNAAFDE